MKAIEQYFHVGLFIMLYKVVPMKAIGQYFHVVLFIDFLSFASVEDALALQWEYNSFIFRTSSVLSVLFLNSLRTDKLLLSS